MASLTHLFGKLRRYYRMSRNAQNQGHLSVFSQSVEMALLFGLRRIGPGQYHGAKLWRREIPFKKKLGWRNEKEYRARVCQYNPRPYQKISQNKLPEKGILNLFGIPTAQFYGLYHPIHGRSTIGDPLRSGLQVAEFLKKLNIVKFCLKELEGWGGRGFQALEVVNLKSDLYIRPLLGGNPVPVASFFDQIVCPSDGLIIEAYVEQHPVMRGLNPSSLNTIRLIAVSPIEGNIEVAGAFVRIGRSNSLVDNTTSGGMSAIVETQTGRVGSAHFKPPNDEDFERHPDHGAQIKGICIPFWPQVLDLAKMTLPLFPHFRYAGFDIAVTESGPVVIELNVEPDKTGPMQIDVPIDDLLPVVLFKQTV